MSSRKTDEEQNENTTLSLAANVRPSKSLLFFIFIVDSLLVGCYSLYMMIIQLNATEFQLVKGGHVMTLRKGESAWYMSTQNTVTRAWNGRLGSLKRFETLGDVEKHYKSWRGVAALVA